MKLAAIHLRLRGSLAWPGARPAITWLLAVPLIALGTQSAHALDYRLVVGGSERAAVLRATGHSYLNFAPQFLAICATLVSVALLLRIARRRASPLGGLPVWPFAVLPPLAFALQEHLERLMHNGAIPWAASLEPTFLPGLLLQLPFALLAYALARALMGAAGLVARLLEDTPPLRPRRAAQSRRPRPRAVTAKRPSPLAGGCSLRGPPSFSLA